MAKKAAKKTAKRKGPRQPDVESQTPTAEQVLGNGSPLIVTNSKGDVSKAGTIKKWLTENPGDKSPKEVAELLGKETGLAISANDVSMAKTALKGSKGSKGRGKAKKAPGKAPRAPQSAPAMNGHQTPAQLAKALVKAVGASEALVYIKVVGELG